MREFLRAVDPPQPTATAAHRLVHDHMNVDMAQMLALVAQERKGLWGQWPGQICSQKWSQRF